MTCRSPLEFDLLLDSRVSDSGSGLPFSYHTHEVPVRGGRSAVGVKVLGEYLVDLVGQVGGGDETLRLMVERDEGSHFLGW